MKLLKAVILALALSLPGCVTLDVFPTDMTVENISPKQQAQDLINEVNIDIAAASNVIKSNLQAGYITVAQAQKQLNQLKDLRDQMNKAQEVLDLGFFADAKSRAEATKLLLATLRKELADYAKENQ